MQGRYTFSMIKPDAVRANHIGAILSMIEKTGFSIHAISMLQLTPAAAEHFYAVHAHRPFYKELCSFIASGPVVAMVLEKEHAVADLRKLMGATNPAEAADGTIRKAFATSIDYNAIHGSDSDETAASEIAFFFPGRDLLMNAPVL
ncbi:Nucleoside diphosphate kinase [Cardinium endosymbiont of Sogatella furcifera]|uniref:nucleoside-diphosphate kinase n=1 Tax=Cardinium endosymbiont of Sogatella furcifera TaxID=650378 RepID=UPI000E0D2715|nr:nucleoside-diphosphate kinase [Cardinium endosymbiont of Sogatella furcifera]AXI24155.1 Nucleoside diphosphate kinase [Cardinium endosymbiont of Sogatella furcifera]